MLVAHHPKRLAGAKEHARQVHRDHLVDVLGKTVLVPDGTPTSLGSGIFALLAAGAFKTIEEAQEKVCLPLSQL